MPLRVRALSGGRALVTADTGRFFASGDAFLERWLEERLDEADERFLCREGHLLIAEDDLAGAAYSFGVAQRIASAETLNYLILVPTLRCNLSCTYCQVSRAAPGQAGYDWSEGTLEAVLRLIDSLSAPAVKIEFQGGEPTLRPDLMRAVIERCETRRETQFVVCTNLSRIDEEILEIFDRPNVYISTSLDGDLVTHRKNRTISDEGTSSFARNLDFVLARYGVEKVSALPTIDPINPPDVEDLIESYARRGLTSIYVRPVNFHGFARKRHHQANEPGGAWKAYYEAFIGRLIERNWEDRSRVLEESYFTHCLNRIFRPGHDRHVDLRNPNPIGVDYIVIDHDGTLYPTDEARMLSRSGVIDLSIGDIHFGLNESRRALLNAHASNTFDRECARCAYQPYCGRDIVDDIARYGRIDLRRTETEFCRRHLHLFDFIFELIYSNDEPTLYSLARWLHLPGFAPRLGVLHA
jgi:His-Xaa-Ser system radical SAM maturase HxsB